MNRELDTMSMLQKQLRYDEDFVSEKKQQGAFCDSIKPDKEPFLEYEEISSLNKLNTAFDLLFEEVIKNNIL
jgi:hypothetical protein